MRRADHKNAIKRGRRLARKNARAYRRGKQLGAYFRGRYFREQYAEFLEKGASPQILSALKYKRLRVGTLQLALARTFSERVPHVGW